MSIMVSYGPERELERQENRERESMRDIEKEG